MAGKAREFEKWKVHIMTTYGYYRTKSPNWDPEFEKALNRIYLSAELEYSKERQREESLKKKPDKRALKRDREAALARRDELFFEVPNLSVLQIVESWIERYGNINRNLPFPYEGSETQKELLLLWEKASNPDADSSVSKKPKARIPQALRYDVFERDGHKCVSCGQAPPDVVLHVDHIVPESKGGGAELDNLQALCEDCNLGKGDRYSTDLRR